MKFVSKLLKCLFWVLIIALLVAPIGLISEISNREKAQYAVPTAPKFVETAYGSIATAERMDVKESVAVTGVFRSYSYIYMELNQKEPSQIRWSVSVGEEIQEGQSLGTYKGEDITATCSGLIREIQAYNSSDAYIKVQQATPVVLECDVSLSTLLSLEYAKELTTLDGEAAELVYVANIRNSDGSTHIRLQIDSEDYFLNQTVEDMGFYTGNEFLQALVLPEDCLYQRTAGEDEPWFVRQVSENGFFEKEVEVERGYCDNGLVCVTGIEEGKCFDVGYGAFIQGGGQK